MVAVVQMAVRRLAVVVALGALALPGLGGPVAAAPLGTDDAAWDPLRSHREAGAQVSQLKVPTKGHVRYVAANGDNSDTGRASAPWKTVRHAISKAPAGSTIVVYGKHRGRGSGVYAEQDWGTIETPNLTIQAFPGEQPVFKGSRSLRTKRGAWKRAAGGWYQDVKVGSAERWPGNPYEIPDQVTDDRPQADDPAQVFVGPTRDTAEALDEMDRGQWDATEDDEGVRRVPPGRFFFDPPADDGRTGRLWLGADPGGSSVEWSTRQTAVRIDPDGRGTKIVGISFTNYSPYHGNTLGTIRILASGVQLVDVSVTNSAGTAIAASGENGTLTRPLRNLTLRRVTASDNGALGASIGDAGREGADPSVHNRVTIEYSRFDHNNREGFDVADCGDGSNCAIAGAKLVRLNGVVVRYSSFEGNDATGLWCDLFCERAALVGNHVVGNTLSGIYYEVSGRATIASNVIAHNASAGEDRGPGAARAAGLKTTGSTDVVVEHNTFHANSRQQVFVAADGRDDGPPWHERSGGTPTLRLVGNLFAEGGTGDRIVLGTLDGDTVEADWLTGSGGNGYVVSAEHRPGPGDDTQVRAPGTAVFASAAAGDYRVADPVVSAWTGSPLSDAARSTMHLDAAPTAVGAAFVR